MDVNYISRELEKRAHHASQMDKKARRKAGKGEEWELWNTCTTDVAQSIVAVYEYVCSAVPFSRDNYDEDDDDNDDDDNDGDNGTGMCYTLSSCRPGRLVSKQLFRP